MGRARGEDKPAQAADKGSACGCFCYSIPWVKFACLLAIIAGAAAFFLKSGECFGAVRTLLTELKVQSSVQSLASTVTSALLAAGLAVLLAIIVLSVVAVVSSLAGNARRYRMRHGGRVDDKNRAGSICQMGTSVIVIALMWLALALVVVMIAVWTAMLLGGMSGDHGAGAAMGTTDKIQEKLGRALKKVDSLFTKMRNAWDGLVSRVPSFLKNNSWFGDLTANIGAPILEGSKSLGNVTCAEDCLDLGVFAAMVAFEPRCVCGHDMLTKIQTRSRTTWQGSQVSLIALGVIAIAASWIMMSQIGEFVHAARDLREARVIRRYQDAADETGGVGGSAATGGADDAVRGAGRDVELAVTDQNK